MSDYDMLPEQAWGLIEADDMAAIGIETVTAINKLTYRTDAYGRAVLAAKIRQAFAAHPEIYAAVVARRRAAVDARDARPMSEGVARALALAD
jgi:hypothetical protein